MITNYHELQAQLSVDFAYFEDILYNDLPEVIQMLNISKCFIIYQEKYILDNQLIGWPYQQDGFIMLLNVMLF